MEALHLGSPISGPQRPQSPGPLGSVLFREALGRVADLTAADDDWI